MRATASAGLELSTASTRARGNAYAQAMAMHPEPVPMSFWESLRWSRGRVCKNRRSDGANVQVVVEAKS